MPEILLLMLSGILLLVMLTNLKENLLVEFCCNSGWRYSRATYLLASWSRLYRKFVRLWKSKETVNFTESGDAGSLHSISMIFVSGGSFGPLLVSHRGRYS